MIVSFADRDAERLFQR